MFNENEKRIHPPDFRVKYSFNSSDDGGRDSLPKQGYRCDFSYSDNEFEPSQVWMIWPKFIKKDGTILNFLDPIDRTGIANMRIVNPELRKEIHQRRVKVGVKGFFREGEKRVANLEVIEILELLNN